MTDRDPDIAPARSVHTTELDVVDSTGAAPSRRHELVRPPQVRLGQLRHGGIAPAIAAIVERGVRRRPARAAAITAEIELQIAGPYPPIRIVFGDRLILVEDAPAVAPDLRIEAELSDLVSLMVTPTFGGLPNPIRAGGRHALRKVVYGHVKVEGRIGLMRRFLAVIRF
ncbi:MAG: hypothetical protein ACYDHH_05030 [Solirubrobacteraceae bacterium]